MKKQIEILKKSFSVLRSRFQRKKIAPTRVLIEGIKQVKGIPEEKKKEMIFFINALDSKELKNTSKT